MLLSVDPGAVKIGWALYDEENLYDWGFYSPQFTLKRFNDQMNEGLRQVYPFFAEKSEKYRVTHIACEIVPSFSRMGQRERVMVTAVALKCIAIQNGLYWKELAPRAVKKAVTGDGNAS